MEELRSTEAIEKEIQDEANAQAKFILEKAERDTTGLRESLKTRVNDFERDAEKTFQKKITEAKLNFEGRIPLEKSRRALLFAERAIIKNINEYLSNLSKETRLSILVSRFSKYKQVFARKKFGACVFGFTAEETKAAFQKNNVLLLSLKQIPYETVFDEFEQKLDLHEGIIVEAEDKSVFCKLTFSEMIGEILKKYRSELVKALFGEGMFV